MKIKICKYCGREFEHKFKRVYCSIKCAKLQKYDWMKNDYRKRKSSKIKDKKYKAKHIRTEKGRIMLRQKNKKYSRTLKGKINKRLRQKKYMEKNPEKIKAQSRTKILKMKGNKCLICGKQNKLHFHHTNYEFNMGCTLCNYHHLEQHGVKIYALIS